MSHTSHSQIHANLGALALEIGAQVFHNVLAGTLGNAYHVLSSPRHLTALLHELLAGSLALGAELGSLGALENVTANRTYKLLH